MRDGTAKMSKSDPSDMSRINLADDPDEVMQKVKKAKTDPEPLPSEEAGLAGRPEALNLVTIYAALADSSVAAVLAQYGGQGFGAFKPALGELMVETLRADHRALHRTARRPRGARRDPRARRGQGARDRRADARGDLQGAGAGAGMTQLARGCEVWSPVSAITSPDGGGEMRKAIALAAFAVAVDRGSGRGAGRRLSAIMPMSARSRRRASATFADDAYRLTASGANIWGGADAFHYAWTQRSGDLHIAADIAFEGKGGDPHRKAGLMIRQNLTPGSPYADVMVHGDGMVALQYREVQDGPTRQIVSAVTHPRRVRLEREGDFVYFSVAGADGELAHAGGSFRIAFQAPYMVGLALSAHDNAVTEAATFSERRAARCRNSPTCPTPATPRRSKRRSRSSRSATATGGSCASSTARSRRPTGAATARA